MCGIAGFVGIFNNSLLNQLSADLAHRGPDGEGILFKDNVGLLSRRLAIIDRQGGDQPIFNEDKTIAVVFNGEIYNFLELKNELKTLGHVFATNTDTEVIIHAYESWGIKSFDRLNGMFAFALYDCNKSQVLLVRDHFGIKPLYYVCLPQGIIFSSEITPLLNTHLFPRNPNDRVIYRYLAYRVHDDGKETFFSSVNRLLAGELMIINLHKPTKPLFEFFSSLKSEVLQYRSADKLNRYQIDKFKELLLKSIKLRLISEVPVGTCLSGGLDSSFITAVVNSFLKSNYPEAKNIGASQNTFSAVFPSSTNDEEFYINSVLQSLDRLEGHKIKPQPEVFYKELIDFINTQEEPTISSGPYAQYKVMELAKKHVTVLLDGQGADEMLAGYIPYYFVYWLELKKGRKYLSLIKELFSARDILINYLWRILLIKIGLKKQPLPVTLLNPEFVARFQQEKYQQVNDNLKKRLADDIFSYSLPALLRYEDKNSMHFSLEGRVPFLDKELLKYLFSLPNEAIIYLGKNKFILRSIAIQYLPQLIVNRRNKIGFTTPEYEWFMRLKNKIYNIFLSHSFANRPYFNQKEVLRYFQLFVEGKIDDTMIFWRLLNLELWLRIFFDKKKSKIKLEKKIYTAHYVPNPGKKLAISYKKRTYFRFPLKTELFKKGDVLSEKIFRYVDLFYRRKSKYLSNHRWWLVVSEKIVAISEGRSYFIWEIKPSWLAKLFSRFVKKTPFGIGLGSPWTMELAIREAGTIKIVIAALLGAFGKLIGYNGLFYRVAGKTVAAIDGPTEYSLYPSNVSAKLGPRDPQKTAEDLTNHIRSLLPSADKFSGVIIIDANDLGQTVLGNTTKLKAEEIVSIFSDNPMGQSDEQTPLVIVCE